MSDTKRELEIDAARGLMLVWMTLTHLPTALTPWVNQPFGYVSSSDGFIFLSALFTGRIYYRLLMRGGLRAMGSKLLWRTLRLYGYHVLLLLFAFLIAARYAMATRSVSLYNLLDYYFTVGRTHAIGDALFLVYRPPLLDIIPLYIIFLLISPLVIVASTRVGWKIILAASGTIWLLAQFGLREASYRFLSHHFGVQIPLNEMGAFNLWAWQLMWVFGMWCGVRWAQDDLPTEKWAQRTWIPTALLALSFLVLRYFEIFGLNLGHWSPLFDKWHIGIVRLIDFTAVATLLIRFRSAIKPLAVKPLVLMGQSSLRVFCMHFVFCFIGIAMMGSAERIFGWKQAALVVVTFAALYWIAKISARPELSAQAGDQRESQGKSRPASPANGFTRAA